MEFCGCAQVSAQQLSETQKTLTMLKEELDSQQQQHVSSTAQSASAQSQLQEALEQVNLYQLCM